MISIKNLSDNEISRLLALKNSMWYGTYGKIDSSILSLTEKGYITRDNNKIMCFYKFTDEGEKETDNFWDKYSKIVQEKMENHGATFTNYQSIVIETGLSWSIIGEIIKYLNIELDVTK